MMYKFKLLFIMSLFISFFTFYSFGGEKFCELQPDKWENEKDFIRLFEKNIEERATEIYQEQYPILSEQFQVLKSEMKNLYQFENSVVKKYVKPARKHHKNQSIYKQRMRVRRALFLELFEQNIDSQEEWDFVLKDNHFIRSLPFEDYQNLLSQMNQLKTKVSEVSHFIQSIQAPHFLYIPEVDFSVRGRDIVYGNLKMEVFLTPPEDDLFRLPFLDIGFEINKNTEVYICVHMDAFDEEKNVFYVYFLNRTKLYNPRWRDAVLSTDLVLRSLLTTNRPPKAVITPLPFEWRTSTTSTVDNLQKATQTLPMSGISSLESVTSVVNQLDFLDFTAHVHPALKIFLDNVNIGIKGVLVQPNQLSIRYAGSTLYGLVNFNLANQGQKMDFSSFMNIMTLEN